MNFLSVKAAPERRTAHAVAGAVMLCGGLVLIALRNNEVQTLRWSGLGPTGLFMLGLMGVAIGVYMAAVAVGGWRHGGEILRFDPNGLTVQGAIRRRRIPVGRVDSVRVRQKRRFERLEALHAGRVVASTALDPDGVTWYAVADHINDELSSRA